MSAEKNKNKKKRTLFQKIVNVFLIFFIAVFLLILLLLGITQTSTFREYLREKVIEIANSELNGKVNIARIDGTIFTSLILHETLITMEADTILDARKIELRTSPLKLLVKEIFIRKFEITDAKLNIITDREGNLNIAKLFPESEEDTTTSEFPFTIQADDIRLTNVDLNFQNYNMRESNEIYEELVLDDLRIRELNLVFSASLDINENDYTLEIKHFSFNPNLNSVQLKNLTGKFIVNKEMLRAEDLRIVTKTSDVLLTAELTGYNVFDTLGTSQFSNAGVILELTSDSLDFNDVARMSDFTMLKGDIKADISATGSMQDLTISNMELDLENTHIQASGSILNLLESDSMYMKINFEDSYVNQNDIKNLFAETEIPVYNEYGLLRFDTLSYEGTLDEFNIRLMLRTDRGDVYTNSNINLKKDDIAYDGILRTNKLDLAPFAGVETQLNIRSDFRGIGSEPSTILADINLIGDGSIIQGNKLDTLRLIADSKNQLLNYNLTAVMDTVSARLTGFFNFENEHSPVYELEGKLRNLNLATFTDDTTTETNLNFDLNASGESFNPDSINLFVTMTLANSLVNDIKIDSTRAIVDLQNGSEGERVINIISDLADITFMGRFTTDQAVSVISKEIEVLQTILSEQLEQITPSDTVTSRVIAEINGSEQELIEEGALSDSIMSIKYLVDFKDFALLSLFMGGESQLEINGEMNGEITSDGDSLHLTYNTILEYVKYRSEKDVFFLSNLNLNVNLQNRLDTISIDLMSADLSLTTDRIFMGNDINGLSLQFSLKNRAALMDFAAQLEDYASIHLNGGFNVSEDIVFLNLDTLELDYKGFQLINPHEIKLGYSENKITVDNFLLTNDSAQIKIDGSLLQSGGQNMKMSITDLSLNKLSTTILGARPENALSATLNMNAEITGSLSSPVVDLLLRIDSVTYKNQTFGNLVSEMNFKDELLKADIRFIDSTLNAEQPDLLITASVPVSLSQDSTQQLNSEQSPMKINFTADEFNLGAFGDILPGVNRLRGQLNADIDIGGTLDNPLPEGSIELKGGAFFIEANNLEYYANLKVTLNGNVLTLDNLVLENSSDTPDGGKMSGSGRAEINNMELESSQFIVNGRLKVLSPNSKSASPGVFGDLVIETDGKIEFTTSEDGAKLKAPIIVKKAELTFPPTQGAYENTATNFVYKYVEDTIVTLGGGDLDFESLVEISRQRGQSQEIRTAKGSSFDYEIDVEVEDEAEIIFVLSKELNQNLSAILKGNFSYASVNGKSAAKGELKLLEGSTLEFIKTFEADGSVRFENELNNPYLDITATYRDYYYPSDSTETGANEVEVAVKIKLKGFLNELDKTFIREENNIAVYYGEKNIEEDNPDPTKTPTDAIMFIITGRFASDLTQSERTAAAGQFSGTATSMAGSLLGGFLNRQFGDYVRSVELRRVGSETKFNLSGRVKNFRYTIGGSTDVFDDLSQANIRIEYPLFENFLLRLERKEAITERTINTEMINELGLKYRFEF